MKNNYPLINVYKKNNKKSEIATQLLYGEKFKKLRKLKNWIKIKNNIDNYTGYIKNRNFTSDQKNTHKVQVLFSNLYLRPSIKYKTNKKLSFGSRVRITKKKGSFYKFDNYWIKTKDLRKNNEKTKDIFKNIKKFSNVKYKWGGKHFDGVDCSGLIQLFLNFNNRFCPRDTKDQIKFFKRKIKLENIKKNDLIFWKGHVAVVLSKKKLIHAYGPFKKVVTMSINQTINRILKTANLKVIGVRRIK